MSKENSSSKHKSVNKALYRTARTVETTSVTKAGIILIALGLASLASFGVIGSSIDPNGVLREPLGLLPIGYLLLLLGALLVAGSTWSALLGVLLNVVALPFTILLVLVRLPWLLWKARRGFK